MTTTPITEHVTLTDGTLHVSVPAAVTVNDDQLDIAYKSKLTGEKVYVAVNLELLRQR